MCREKPNHRGFAYASRGSPLRVQGKAVCQEFPQFFIRITPACAGKSVKVSSCNNDNEDHPCVCREKVLQFNVNGIY